MAHASFFSIINDVFGGKKAQASVKITPIIKDIISNSQTMPLLEVSNNPNIKKTKNIQEIKIIENQALSPNDGFGGVGLENISTGGIVTYTVKKGDTLSQLAEDFDISVNTIRWENNISGQKIKIGQKLNILPVTGVKHIVKNGDNLGKIANKYDAVLNDILVYNGIDRKNTLHKGDILLIPNGIIKTIKSKRKYYRSSKTYHSNVSVKKGYYIRPTRGRITSPFGPRRGGFHYGIDIGAKRGTPVLAAASGTVVKVINYCRERRPNCGGRYGNNIKIKHSNGTTTRYAHLGKALVRVGQKVKQGQLIAKTGNTGHTTGPHLHFEIINSNGSKLRPRF